MEDKLESLQLKLSKQTELCVTMAEEKDTLREALKDSELETSNYRNLADNLDLKLAKSDLKYTELATSDIGSVNSRGMNLRAQF